MKIRPVREGDVNFILSTWLKSYYEALRHYGQKGCPYPKDDVFFQGHQDRIKEKLKASECFVCVAPDEDNQIIGWIVLDKAAVHYIYVKQVFRKMGVAKKLLLLSQARPLPIGAYSHHTKYAKFLNKGLIYDPYKF